MRSTQMTLMAGAAAAALALAIHPASAQSTPPQSQTLQERPGASPQTPGRNITPGQSGTTGSTADTQRSGTQTQTQAQQPGSDMQRNQTATPGTSGTGTGSTGSVQRSPSQGGTQSSQTDTQRSQSGTPGSGTSGSAQRSPGQGGTQSSQTDPQRSQSGTPGAGTSGSAQGSTAQGSQQGGDTNITLESNQRERVRERLVRDAPRAPSDVNINVSVGQSLPPRVSLREVPPDIVQIVPRYRGYQYVVVQDEIVIVEPQSRRIVTVIERASGNTASSGQQRIQLTSEQRRLVLRQAMQNRAQASARGNVQVSVGSMLPQSVEVHSLPRGIVSEVPSLRDHRYVIVEDRVVLVSPRDNRIVEVIRSE